MAKWNSVIKPGEDWVICTIDTSQIQGTIQAPPEVVGEVAQYPFIRVAEQSGTNLVWLVDPDQIVMAAPLVLPGGIA